MKETLIAAYRRAEHRLLLLDYDGTLVDFAPTPPEAIPDKRLLGMLRRLAGDPHNLVAIISGRDSQTLDSWLGGLPIALVAEHGYRTKLPGGMWTTTTPIDPWWQAGILQEIQQSLRAVPSSHIERKESALVWHNRLADPCLAEAETARLLARLAPIAQAHHLRVQLGNRIVEVRPAHVTKGAAARLLTAGRQWDFALAAGDDATDEDLFVAMPKSTYTIKIGGGPTTATHRLPSPAALRELLVDLSNS